MAVIERAKKSESLTIMTVSGVLTCEEIINSFEDFLKLHVTPDLLWDFSDASLYKITFEDMERIIEVAKSLAYLRNNGKTALFVPTDISFGLSELYGFMAEQSEYPVQVCVFKSLEKALEWLA